MIQHIDLSTRNYRTLGFGNPHTLDQVGIEPQQRPVARSCSGQDCQICPGAGFTKRQRPWGITCFVAECSAESVSDDTPEADGR